MIKHGGWTTICLMLCLGVLTGCAIHRSFIPEVHKVRRGESLSVIATHYGLNWHNLARWNHIKPPYTIYVGERLSLDPFPPLDYDRMRRQRQVAVEQQHPNSRSTVTALHQKQSFSVIATKPRQSGTRRSGRPIPTHPKTPPTAPSAKTPSRMAKATDKTTRPLINDSGWRWPLADSVLGAGKIRSARHGVNIRGVEGTPVYAARSGQVVYSGAGLQGIGDLVIIQHRDEYLSAYGYVHNLQVAEGDRIKAGEHIADMGLGPGSQAELHFEIRHEGEPIKPQSVLPDP